MKPQKLSILFLILSCLVSEGYSRNDKVIREIIRLGQTDNQKMNHLDVLTKRIRGRISGSDAYDNAAKWCAEQFRKWGLEVIMDEAGTLPVGFNRGSWFGRMLSENGMILHFATPSYIAGTKEVQKGHVLIEPKTREELNLDHLLSREGLYREETETRK